MWRLHSAARFFAIADPRRKKSLAHWNLGRAFVLPIVRPPRPDVPDSPLEYVKPCGIVRPRPRGRLIFRGSDDAEIGNRRDHGTSSQTGSPPWLAKRPTGRMIPGRHRLPDDRRRTMLSSFDPHFAVAGFLVGALVGLTGVGGGSLMTPILILLFGVSPATAVGTDLLFAAATKTVGSLVHGYNKTIAWRIVLRLAAGSLAGHGVRAVRALAAAHERRRRAPRHHRHPLGGAALDRHGADHARPHLGALCRAPRHSWTSIPSPG